jgi:hypothetical protein
MKKRSAKKVIFKDRYIQSHKPERKEYWVHEDRGFTIRISPSGVKTFYIRYTYNGKQKNIHLKNT